MTPKRLILGIVIGLFIIASLGVTVYLSRQQQNNRSNASEPTQGGAIVPATNTPVPPTGACKAPAQVQNVRVTYPHCQ